MSSSPDAASGRAPPVSRSAHPSGAPTGRDVAVRPDAAEPVMPPSPHSPPALPPSAPGDAAGEWFTRELRGEADPAALVAAVERFGVRVPEGLARWFGPYGARALVTRALARARADHPALAAVHVTDGQPPCLTGLAESAGAHGARAAADGVLALLSSLSESLGRLIGDDLTSRLLAQSLPPQSAAAPDAYPPVKEP
jgi:hypothetical protein